LIGGTDAGAVWTAHGSEGATRVGVALAHRLSAGAIVTTDWVIAGADELGWAIGKVGSAGGIGAANAGG
jgi:hypothetical protein